MRDDILNERGMFGDYGLTIAWQRRARREGRGPRFLKLGKMVRYRRADVEAWLEASAIEPKVSPQPQTNVTTPPASGGGAELVAPNSSMREKAADSRSAAEREVGFDHATTRI